jgi:hypothetical protein
MLADRPLKKFPTNSGRAVDKTNPGVPANHRAAA